MLKTEIRGNLRKQISDEGLRLARGATRAVQRVTTGGKNALRRQVIQAGLGGRVANAWRDQLFPGGSRVSMGAAGFIYSKAPNIVRAFDQGSVIRSPNGFWLAIPTEQAPKRGRGGKRITPANFPEDRFGPLRLIPAVAGVGRAGRLALLVVDAARIGTTGRARAVKGGAFTKRGKVKKGVATVVMFILVPQVRLSKRLDVKEVGAWAKRALPRELVREWDKRNARQ